MKTLNDLRNQHGEFTFPVKEEMIATIERIDRQITPLLSHVNLTQMKGRVLRAVRLDLASQAISEGDGYNRVVRSFSELTRPELIWVEAWVVQHASAGSLVKEMMLAGWLPKPTAQRIRRLLRENPSIPTNTMIQIVKTHLT